MGIRLDDLTGPEIHALLEEHLKEMRRISPPEGVARAMLEHIIAEARRHRYARLGLETRSMPHFAPARGLYERYGFARCPPFGTYFEDPNSVCMTRLL